MTISKQQERQVQKALESEAEGADETAEVRVHEDETREMRTPGFSRMRTEWNSHDAQVMSSLQQTIEDQIVIRFPDVFRILAEVYNIVREPEVDADGVIQTDRYGWPVWKVDADGRYIEDFSTLGIKERDHFMFQITTRLVEWEQTAANVWAEAMFAKAQWEERFSLAFFDTTDGGRRTDEAMTQRGRTGSMEERYFALFQSSISRKADALVRSMARLEQRLKDTLPK